MMRVGSLTSVRASQFACERFLAKSVAPRTPSNSFNSGRTVPRCHKSRFGPMFRKSPPRQVGGRPSICNREFATRSSGGEGFQRALKVALAFQCGPRRKPETEILRSELLFRNSFPDL